MTDVYKLIANTICNSIDDDWEKAVVEIESSFNRMLSTSAHYIRKNGEEKAFELQDDDQEEDLGEIIFGLQESMFGKHKWNRAVFTLESNGKFNMDFKWDQELQDKWDGKK